MKKRGARFNRDVCTVNPCFSLGDSSRIALAVQERLAFDALLQHRAQAEDIEVIAATLETAIRAVRMTHKEAPHLFEPGGLAETQRVLMRAAHAMLKARQRFDKTGVYGLDGPGRLHITEADELIAHTRKPGTITRRTWLLAHRQNLATRDGIPIARTIEDIDTCTI